MHNTLLYNWGFVDSMQHNIMANSTLVIMKTKIMYFSNAPMCEKAKTFNETKNNGFLRTHAIVEEKRFFPPTSPLFLINKVVIEQRFSLQWFLADGADQHLQVLRVKFDGRRVAASKGQLNSAKHLIKKEKPSKAILDKRMHHIWKDDCHIWLNLVSLQVVCQQPPSMGCFKARPNKVWGAHFCW